MNELRVAVRTLCEFAARKGDLDLRYTPAPTSEEGIAGHSAVQARRGPRYQSEVALAGQCGPLMVSGRADGYDPIAGRLEEIKTHRGDLSRVREAQRNLHRAQLRVYGAMLCRQENLKKLELALIYYDVGKDRETPIVETASAEELWQELEQLCALYSGWAEQEAGHRQARDQALSRLTFPFPHFRPQQRALAETVYRNSLRNRKLLLEAPTGLGKTLGTLFPALMAMPAASQDRLFYLTSRNTARHLAVDAVHLLREKQPNALPLRTLELVAKDHACEHPDKACHGDSCPLAKGFFDRLPQARAEAVCHTGALTQAVLADIASDHGICPYFLAQEMARWCDVVVADVNRMFDQSALLHALVRQNDWKASLLIDEAHNLVDRARGMYSVELSQARLLRLRRQAPKALKAGLDGVSRAWQSVIRDHAPEISREPVILDNLPGSLTGALNRLVSAITDYLADHPPDLALQELMFESLAFTRLAEVFGDHSLCELVRPGRGKAEVAIRNLIPADFLRPRFEAASSTLLFSATLSPGLYYRDLLGMPEDTCFQSLPGPFSADQLEVHFTPRISTRQAHRERSLRPIAELIARQYRERSGNYLAFFSSFAYLNRVRDTLADLAPDIPLRAQQPGMSGEERTAFLEDFREGDASVAFAVLGGVFGEGIDLPGDRLIGAFVATLGLPPFDAWHEILRQRLERRFGAGQAYTYLIPGLQKVAQAAGRVIRTPEDRGVIWLIDDRFLQPDIRQLLPGWWIASKDTDDSL
ncbi:ATP-dependent DNA helicase [Marinobacter vulgaris]|uniref:ATP-dependent DNA helicase n=1 Tax=Marinobacter vulgaris TaxID=1928331 RepID=A0A2V3ZM17_9GAMM|nr:ATP-dependent DNA helicase [Marinobacter vulgaris]PXX92425.1 ATP-dependent DNA helicase [Marinobacter vulgaris]TSJ71633.1 ATP-dependent DNA helicase [Marinobacter vulgaris]